MPEIIKKFIDVFSKLPSIGPRLATRLAFYLTNLNQNELYQIEKTINALRYLDKCPNCFFLKEKNKKLCSICLNPQRNKRTIMIIEKETDLITVEKTKAYNGHYLILGELKEKNSLETIQKLKLKNLKERIKKELEGKIEEIIIALNPNTFGDLVSDFIKQEFKNYANKITRLGRGIPTGGEIEFSDEETLKEAIKRRN
ncbi:MAG: toprim domain-containing protein [Candidatus Pacearchaeota archaeon]